MDEADLLGDRCGTVLPVSLIRHCPKPKKFEKALCFVPGAAVVAVMLPCRYAVATAVADAKADADAVAVAPDSGYAGKKEKRS
jgi:hypothetical protein